MTDDVTQSAAAPCSECPWRNSNKGRPVPPGALENPYDSEAAGNRWKQLARDGRTMVCHMSDLDPSRYMSANDLAWIELGYAPVPEGARPRECAGSVAAVLRELHRVRRAGSWEAYHREHPHGFTPEAAQRWARRRLGRDVDTMAPPLREQVHVAAGDLADVPATVELRPEQLISNDLFRRVMQVAQAKLGMQCQCSVCARHGQFHKQVSVRVDGREVPIDAALAPLVEALVDAGVHTVASCQDLAGLIEQADPDRATDARNLHGQGLGLHYQDVVQQRLAYVRLLVDTKAAVRFVAAAEKVPGSVVTQVTRTGVPVAQVAFALDRTSDLRAVARKAQAAQPAPKPDRPPKALRDRKPPKHSTARRLR